MNYLVVQGFELHPSVCFFIIDRLMSENLIKNPDDAQEYISHHRIEDNGRVVILRNPYRQGMHFSFSKELPHYIYK